jgi:lipopolysaccharide export system protein LptA
MQNYCVIAKKMKSGFIVIVQIFFVMFFTNQFVVAQNQRKDSTRNTKIRILQANEGSPHYKLQNTHLLSGNVIFEHDSTLMYCDSAYFFLDINAFQAFSNIKIVRGDSIQLTGDTLYYKGIPKTAEILGNIVYNDRKMNLVTEALFYDFKTKIASYDTLATITSLEDKNTLVSKKGIYHSKTQTMYFKDSVRLKNEKYTTFSDTLIYQMNTKVATFRGPTDIISKENTIYCEAGIYDTENEISSLWKNARIISKEHNLSGDSIYYERNKGVGEVFGNVLVIDTTNKVNLIGDYAYHDEFLDSTAIIGNGQMTQFFEKDTLYVKANYLLLKTDSTNENKNIRAYGDVKIFKSDFQAVCDSLSYNDTDSLMKFYIDPILWSGKSQITGNYIEAKTGKGEIKLLNVLKDAFIISEIDSIMYDQIKGRDINAYFEEGKITNVDVWGNGQTLYFIQNSDSLYLEANQAKCATIKIQFDKDEISEIKFLESPTALYKATHDLTPTEKYFDGFEWRILEKPLEEWFVTHKVIEIETEESENPDMEE